MAHTVRGSCVAHTHPSPVSVPQDKSPRSQELNSQVPSRRFYIAVPVPHDRDTAYRLYSVDGDSVPTLAHHIGQTVPDDPFKNLPKLLTPEAEKWRSRQILLQQEPSSPPLGKIIPRFGISLALPSVLTVLLSVRRSASGCTSGMLAMTISPLA